MSRMYEFNVEVGVDLTEKKARELGDAMFEEDECNIVRLRGATFYTGEVTLGGGRDDEEGAREMAEAVWKKFGSRVPVNVRATCLENLPYNEYEFGGDEEPTKTEEGEDGNEV